MSTDWKQFFKGKRVTLVGLGLLGRGVGDAAFIARYAKEVIVTDLKPAKELRPSTDRLKKFKNISYTLGRHELVDFEDRDFILKAAGVPSDSAYIAHAEKNGVPVYMSTALFAKFTPATVVGITGTRGKSTVTEMIHSALKGRKKGRAFLGGNVRGAVTLPMLAKTKKGDIAVLELDSWQLQGFGDLKISPDVAVFTTFMPDHLNYYKGDLAAYFKDKANIFMHQKKGDALIVGSQAAAQKGLKFPSHAKIVSADALPKSLKLMVPGEHNRYAVALAYEALRSLKVPAAEIRKSLSKFRGVPGRLQKIATKRGAAVYNDTNSTTPHALVAALKAFEQKKIVLIMGGSDKGIDLEVLKAPLKEACKAIVLLPGTGTERVLKEGILPQGVSAVPAKDMKAAVREAFKLAMKGDIVLLSPGFASFGIFKNEYDRGDRFVAEVKKLK